VRRNLDDEARALRLSRAEIGRLQQGFQQLQRGQELRNAQLSEETRAVVLREMVNAQVSVANLLDDIALKLIDVNLQRAFVYLKDELQQAVDLEGSTNNEQLISLAGTFVRLDRRYDGVRRGPGRGRPEPAGSHQGVLDLERDVQDFLLVLGISSQAVDAVEWDLSRTQDALRSNIDKLSSGISFYVRGAKILGQDASYSLGLISKAAAGKTLSEREARILKRTARDALTFIPFVIILIIPLSPPGHVLVFSLIQRIFPDFFPSAFSERRQQLIETYEKLVMKDEQATAASAAGRARDLKTRDAFEEAAAVGPGVAPYDENAKNR